jgi:hypothetical protein
MPSHARRELDNARSSTKSCAASKSRQNNGPGIDPEQLLEKQSRSLNLAL